MGMVTPETLRKLIDYNPETGELRWSHRGPEWFKSRRNTAEHNAAKWNSRFAGKPALNSAAASHGYFDGAVMGQQVLAHRVAFAIAHGRWPAGVDHINGDRRDNRLCNLREASQSENMLNVKIRSDNPSGVAGVWALRRGGWRARIKKSGSIIDLGKFDTLEAAKAARKQAEIDLGFHQNHGRAK